MADDTTSKGEKRDLLAEAKEAFAAAHEAETNNRTLAAEDLRFSRLGEQWPDQIRKQYETDGRPMLTINRLPAFIRQVVNDARQNKPSIKVHPADDKADVATAHIINGLIRNIEYTSNADVAYDTATECAVSMGWGYLKVDLDYAFDDTFDLDLSIERVSDPFSIYGDPTCMDADSANWNSAFETEWLTDEEFEDQYPNEDPSSWSGDNSEHWTGEGKVLIAKWWRREEVKRKVLLMTDGRVLDKDDAEKVMADDPAFGEITKLDMLANGVDPDTGALIPPVTIKAERETRSHKVTRHVMNGGEIIKTEKWPGRYIPIIPVYGDEVIDDKGKRHLRSLIRDAKDPQRMFNYWRSKATELVALAPKTPWIGPRGTFKTDARRWATANTENHPYLEFDMVAGSQGPQRQPLDTGAAAGALQEAMNASDDIKATIGIFDAGMGSQGNETSGRAILARQRESDTSTFHFQDNMSRAIRHTGRILIDLIPKVYNSERIIRVMGEDGVPSNVPLMRPVPVQMGQGMPQVMEDAPNGEQMPGAGQATPGQAKPPQIKTFDLSQGKYDLTVTTGPSYTTKREETAVQMTEMMRAFPQIIPIAGDLLVKNLDWQGAEEIAERLKAVLPVPLNGGLPPEVQQQMQAMGAQLEQAKTMFEQMQAYIGKLEADNSTEMAGVRVKQFEAETKRLAALGKIQADGGANVTDAPGPNGDWDGIVAAAEADKLYATAAKERSAADLNHAKAIKELTPPQPAQIPMGPVRLPTLPQRMRG